MTSKESTGSSSKYDQNTNKNEFMDLIPINQELRSTFTPYKIENEKKSFQIKSNPHAFESYCQLDLDDGLEAKKTNPSKKKIERRLTIDSSSETLSNKMPNFLMNYDTLLQMVTSKGGESAKKSVKGSLKATKYSAKDIKQNQKIEPKSECISSLITSVKQKPSKIDDEEQKYIDVKTLTNTEEIRDFYENTEECLKRIAKLKITPASEIEHLLFDLPFEEELKYKKLAVFDLDETLIHCEIKNPNKGEVVINVKIPSGNYAKIGLNIRPFWKESLKEIKDDYVIIVYTASHQSYADSVLDYLDPNKELIQYRLYRQNCVRVKVENDFIYVKDMRIFRNVPMENIIMIDNSALSFAFQLENGIPILPFYNNKDDNELIFLTHYLMHISKKKDLREENRKNLKLDYFLHKAISESSIVVESEEEADVSIEKDPGTNRSEDKNKTANLFSLNICNISDQSEDNSLDISLNNSLNNDLSSRKQKNGETKKNSHLQGQLLNTLVELKKTLEDNLNQSNMSNK